MKAQGFTLFEVILVLVIIAVLTAVILSRNSSSANQARLYGQADLLKAQLRYAQARSMNANQVWGIRAQGQNVSLFNGGSVANQTYLPGENALVVVYNANDLAGLTLNDFIRSFDDRGRPCTDAAGTTLLTAGDAPITLTDTDTGATVTIAITPNTGFIQ